MACFFLAIDPERFIHESVRPELVEGLWQLRFDRLGTIGVAFISCRINRILRLVSGFLPMNWPLIWPLTLPSQPRRHTALPGGKSDAACLSPAHIKKDAAKAGRVQRRPPGSAVCRGRRGCRGCYCLLFFARRRVSRELSPGNPRSEQAKLEPKMF